MTALELARDRSAPEGEGPFFIQVLDHDLNPLPEGEQTLAPAMESLKLALPSSGDYLVQVLRTTGRSFNIPVTVREGETLSVPIRPPQARSRAREPRKREGFGGNTLERSFARFDRFKASRSKQRIWARLWARDARAAGASLWERETPEDVQATSTENAFTISLKGRPGVLRLLQVGGETISWRLIAVPPVVGPISIVGSAARVVSELNGGLEITVSTNNPSSDLLLASLASTEPDAAQKLIEHSESVRRPDSDLAELLLWKKFEDPVAAAIGGYFLLQYGAFERLHDWPPNLDEWFAWLPDGAIIHAWQLLAKPDQPDPAAARARLLVAESRGLPVFTEGLRRLRDGLIFVASLTGSGPPGESDKEVWAALDRLKNYLAAADWDQPLTTFHGLSPDMPGLKPNTGTPKTGNLLAHFDVTL